MTSESKNFLTHAHNWQIIYVSKLLTCESFYVNNAFNLAEFFLDALHVHRCGITYPYYKTLGNGERRRRRRQISSLGSVMVFPKDTSLN
jgi:hypothetical protein